MVEEILVKEQLTKDMIDVGARLVDRLVESGLPISVAMWFFTPETNKWRLLISTPLAADSPREVREQIDEVRKSLGPEAEELLFWSVGLISTRNEVVQALTADMPLGPDAKPVRLTRSAVRGRYIDDALVYRSAA
jgi:hypothetical protein